MLHHNERIRADFSDLDTFFDREKEWLQDILHGKSLLKGSIYETDESITGGSRSGACL